MSDITRLCLSPDDPGVRINAVTVLVTHSHPLLYKGRLEPALRPSWHLMAVSLSGEIKSTLYLSTPHTHVVPVLQVAVSAGPHRGTPALHGRPGAGEEGAAGGDSRGRQTDVPGIIPVGGNGVQFKS